MRIREPLEPLFYENQFGDYCMLSYPNQIVSKEFVFKEINFWEYIKWRLFALKNNGN